VIFSKSTIRAAFLAAFFFSCSESPTNIESLSRGEAIVDSSVAYHGGNLYENIDLSFGFRGKDYQVIRQAGSFEYINTYRDSVGTHRRRLTNDSFTQKLNNVLIALSAKDSIGRASSVNSVIYFVRVSFSKEGGGEDFDDVFLYWFSTENYAMDYLAYSYLEDEGGSRFRKAYNRRSMNGMVFQDYLNLRGPAPDSLEFISEMFKSGELDTLSVIEIDRLGVSPLK
jgi:hypothetical protein